MARRHGRDGDGRNFTPERVNQVWEKAEKIPGKNPDIYRQDTAGNEIYKPSYGKNSEMGWEVDHKNPVDKGGTDNLRNLQPLQTEENKRKGKEYPWEP